MEEIIEDKNVIVKGNGSSDKPDYSDYKPLELNLGVFFSPKCLTDKTSLSLNYTRDYLKFNFTMMTDSGKKEQVFKKFSLSQSTLIAHALRAIVADRMATIQNHYATGAEGKPNYSKLEEEHFTFTAHYYKKETKEYVPTGKITFSTTEVNGVNRFCIKGYSETGMMIIRVVFFDEADGENFYRVSQKTIIDAADLDLYRFAMEIERSLKSTFIYAGFDKIYQAIKARGSYTGNTNGVENQKRGFFGFGNKQQQRQVAVHDSNSNEEGADLFDNDVDF